MVLLIESRTSGQVNFYEPPELEKEKFLRQKAEGQAAKVTLLQEILEAGESISQAGLARHLKINPKTVCKKVTRVIKAGLVENVGCGAKSQTQELRLTAKGRDLIQGVSQRATLAA